MQPNCKEINKTITIYRWPDTLYTKPLGFHQKIKKKWWELINDFSKVSGPEIKWSNCQHSLDHRKSNRIPEKRRLLLYWLSQSLWLFGSQQTVEYYSTDGNTRPPYLPQEKSVCRSRNNRARHGTIDWFQIGNGVRQGCILSPCLFNLYAEYIMWNATLD